MPFDMFVYQITAASFQAIHLTPFLIVGAGPLLAMPSHVDASAGYWGYRALASHPPSANPPSTGDTN